MNAFLAESSIVNFSHPAISRQATLLAAGKSDSEAIARACFEFVRDEIRHSGDAQDSVTTVSASDVLLQRTGWCYAKSHLLAALLRANSIPAGFAYQRLLCSEYEDAGYCLHGLNAVYLDGCGWYRLDARGNKEGVDAQFTPPRERLAFAPGPKERDVKGIFAEPISEVLEALRTNDTYAKMVQNFPDFEGGDR
jgi:transglutaminase-like putative cysteine protease